LNQSKEQAIGTFKKAADNSAVTIQSLVKQIKSQNHTLTRLIEEVESVKLHTNELDETIYKLNGGK